ncbi:MAG: lysine--tRNA ligase, partial [Thermodesulfobacterium geofontis]
MLEEHQIIKVRYEKLSAIEKMGIKSYPNDFRPKDRAKYLKEIYKDIPAEKLEKRELEFSVAGRVMTKREMG